MKKLFTFIMMFAALSMCSDLVENVKSYACGFYEVYSNLKKEYPKTNDKRLGEKDTINYDRNNRLLYHGRRHYAHNNLDSIQEHKLPVDTLKSVEKKNTKGKYVTYKDVEGDEFRVYDNGDIIFMIE